MPTVAGVFRFVRLLGLLALAGPTVLSVALPAAADALHDVYTVSGVPIDATAASSRVARDQAIATGELRAARLLLERLALRRDYARLPQINATDLNGLIEGFSVSNERTSAVRYLADLTVTFKPEAVRNLMAQSGIAIAETPSRPVLVLPVWRDEAGGGLKLFDETNPWRDAWMRIATGKGLVPLLTPLGDVADLNAISADQAASGNAAALGAIAQRYNVGDVIVAVAVGDPANQTISQLIVTRYTIGGGRSTVNVSPRRPPEALLATALAISQEVEEAWKVGTTSPVAQGGDRPWSPDSGNQPAGGDVPMPVLAVRVPVTQLSEWLAIRKRLNDVPQIKKVDVNSLGVDGASVMLSYVGTEQQLQASLAQSDLVLSNDGGFWILRARLGTMPGFAPAAPPANTPPANSPMSNIAPPAGAAPGGMAGGGSPSTAQPGTMPTAGGPASAPPLSAPASVPAPVPAPVYVGPAPGTGGTAGSPTAPAFTAPGNTPVTGAPPASRPPGSILTR